MDRDPTSSASKALVAIGLIIQAGLSHAGVFDREVFSTVRLKGIAYGISAHGFERTASSGETITVRIPNATRAMLYYFRPQMRDVEPDTIDSGIGPVYVEGERLWFGLDFYSGEGSTGIGGVGFLDTTTMQIGLLRHAALVDCAAQNLMVNSKEVIIDTYYFGEYETGPCHGRIAIDRGSLRAWKCGENPGSKRVDGILKCDLLTRKAISKEVLRTPSKPFEPASLDQIMYEQTDFERGWFADAVRHGVVIWDQRCTIAPAIDYRDSAEGRNKPVCKPAATKERGIQSFALQGLANYLCEPDGFAGVPVEAHGIEVTVYPKGPRRSFSTDEGVQGYPIATAGMTWKRFSYRDLVTLVLEQVEFVTTDCNKPYQWASGPAIRAARFWLQVIEVDQDFRPKNVN